MQKHYSYLETLHFYRTSLMDYILEVVEFSVNNIRPRNVKIQVSSNLSYLINFIILYNNYLLFLFLSIIN